MQLLSSPVRVIVFAGVVIAFMTTMANMVDYHEFPILITLSLFVLVV